MVRLELVSSSPISLKLFSIIPKDLANLAASVNTAISFNRFSFALNLRPIPSIHPLDSYNPLMKIQELTSLFDILPGLKFR